MAIANLRRAAYDERQLVEEAIREENRNAMRPRNPDYITPPAEVDESAPIADLGGTLETSVRREYLGPKLTTKEKAPHPSSYGAKEWPSLDAWPKKPRADRWTDNLKAFTGTAAVVGAHGSILCDFCRGSGLQQDGERNVKKWDHYFKTCSHCEGSGRK